MVNKDYINFIKKPENVRIYHTLELKKSVEDFPYFQAGRALYLKSLKLQDSFKYNNELKRTAAYTNDRSILFDFITSKSFETPTKINTKKVEVVAEEIETKQIEKSIQEQPSIEQELNIGKPIDFNNSETHSFNQWLQLATDKKPIVRHNKPEKTSPKASIIDKFISENPKITPLSKANTSSFKPVEQSYNASELMTETLAKVYLEQKKYTSAIKAYEILSLKYPEKSGFFADQIKRIRIIQKNK